MGDDRNSRKWRNARNISSKSRAKNSSSSASTARRWDAVAEAARISKRTLYARYADKAALFDAVLRGLISRWLIPVDQLQLEERGLGDTLLALARHLTTFALTPHSVSVHRIVISEARRWPRFGKLANASGREPAIRAIAAILHRHTDTLRVSDFEMAADQFMSLAVDSSLRLANLGIKSDPSQIERRVHAAVDLFLSVVSRGSVLESCPDGSRTGRQKRVSRARLA
jgi:TetR/AcrR family transcriptional regulator, mexJK operon transcriptional repressor